MTDDFESIHREYLKAEAIVDAAEEELDRLFCKPALALIESGQKAAGIALWHAMPGGVAKAVFHTRITEQGLCDFKAYPLENLPRVELSEDQTRAIAEFRKVKEAHCEIINSTSEAALKHVDRLYNEEGVESALRFADGLRGHFHYAFVADRIRYRQGLYTKP